MHLYVHFNMVKFWQVKLWFCIVQKFGSRKLWRIAAQKHFGRKNFGSLASKFSSEKICWVMKLGRIVCELSHPLSFLPPVFVLCIQ